MPRATVDIDIVIDPSQLQLQQLVRSMIESDVYVSEEAALDAHRRRGQFNVIDMTTLWKVDLIIPTEGMFDRAEMSRRIPRDINGVPVQVATAEDTVIAKLAWSKGGGSERQLEDVAGILRMTGPALDMDYIEQWVDTLSLAQQWQRARQIAEST
jgi:hypothetical protein